MHHSQKSQIRIENDSKILIGLGDSFTQGEGACDVKIWENYDWDVNKMSDKESRTEINKSNLKNSWVHQLCDNYLTDFIPINMGMTGRGNRAAVKELYLHPDLKIEKAKEKIVIFMLTGIERFDFAHKKFFEHLHFQTMWPNVGSPVEESPLWDSYNKFIWSDRFAVVELLLSIAELKNWCKVNNAELILTSAFRPEYDRKYFYNKLRGDHTDYLDESEEYINGIVDIIDWDNFFRPKGFKCITDFLLHLEGREDLQMKESAAKYYEFGYSLDKLSPKGYITKCSHPSYLGHKEIAKVLYEHLITINPELKNQNNVAKKISTNLI